MKESVMRKILLLIGVFIIALSVNAQSDGFFKSSYNDNVYNRTGSEVPTGGLPSLPDFNGDTIQGVEAPLGTGLFLLTALGAGYAISKRRKEER